MRHRDGITDKIRMIKAKKGSYREERSKDGISQLNSEQAELDGLRALDAQALTAIHQRYFPEVFRYARYRLGDEAHAEDIAGEVFTRLLEAVSEGRGPTASLRGWLIGTTSNLVNDYFRGAYSNPTVELPENLQADGPNPVQFAEQSLQNVHLHEAMTRLTIEQQEVIALRFGGNYSLAETADLMGKNTNAIKALQFRALASLRRALEDEQR